MRCGTTSLYYQLREHPDIHLPANRDVPFFIDEKVRGGNPKIVKMDPDEWDRTHDIQEYWTRHDNVANVLTTGEKCADILFWKPAHERLHRFDPSVKIIISLRNPTRRAWSHYWHEYGKGRETLSFEDALEQEERRCEESDFALYHFSYKSRGHYDESLESLARHFPKENLLILIMEETVENPVKALTTIYDFLGVDQSQGLGKAGIQSHPNWVMLPRPWARRGVGARLDALNERVMAKIADALYARETNRFARQDKIRAFMRTFQFPFKKPAGSLQIPAEAKKKLDLAFLPHIERLESTFLKRPVDAWRDNE